MSTTNLAGLGPTVLAVSWAEFAAGTVLMLMRIYTNGFIIRRWSADFWWALVAYVCFCSFELRRANESRSAMLLLQSS